MSKLIQSICVAAALAILPLTSQAIPVTYKITSGNTGNFSGTFLHTAAHRCNQGGYYVCGDSAKLKGTLTFDLDDNTASGSISGKGTNTDMFNATDTWTLTWTGVSAGTQLFVGGETDLLSLDYNLVSSAGYNENGTFYFADKIFTGLANSITEDELYLWGNNWINATGDDRGYGPNWLGLDLYGTTVPEPGVLALLAMGLIGVGATRRKSNT